MNPPVTREEFDALEMKIEALEKVVTAKNEQAALSTNAGQLNRNNDPFSKDTIERVVSERLLNIYWNSFFYYNTWFEGFDGFNIINSVTISGGGCAVTSPGSGVASSSISLTNSSFAGGFSFARESRMRTTAQFTRTATQDIRIGVGACAGTGAHSYGFRVSNATLQGFSQTASGSRTTLDILTIAANTEYDLEARFFPGNRVEFTVDGTVRGSVSTNLPTTAGTKIWEAEATESSAQTKQIFIGSFEYIQKP